MLRLLLSVILLAVPADALLTNPKHAQARSWRERSSSAHVFVVNLDERTDKCGCMSQQLLSSPYPVTRFSAVSGDHLFEHCPNFHNKRLGGHSANNTMALVCSNLEVWEAAVEMSDAEYIIILEDDAILSHDVWDKMDEVMHGSCSEWDYIMVDAWHGNPHQPMDEFACSPNRDMIMYSLNFAYGLSHFQVWRRESLRPAISAMRADGQVQADPMDKLVFGLRKHSDRCKSLRAAAGFFNVSFQAAKNKDFDFAQVPERCRVPTILRDDRPVEVVDGQVVEHDVHISETSRSTEGVFACPS